MPRPLPLPTSLVNRPFTVAEARSRGIPRSRLRAGDLARPHWGVRVPTSVPLDMVTEAQALAATLPADVAFSHLSAARLLGLPTPRPWTVGEPWDVMRSRSSPPIERAGCRPHGVVRPRRLTRVGELLVTAPADTWVDLSCMSSLDDAVALADALVMPPHGLTMGDLDTVIEGRRGARGIRAARRALGLVRVGSCSPWESKARVAFLSHGLPEPQLNVDVWSAEGEWLARPDFVWHAARVVAEYDGDWHRESKARWQYERERRARLESDGWTYVEMTSRTLTRRGDRTHLLNRLSRLLR